MHYYLDNNMHRLIGHLCKKKKKKCILSGLYSTLDKSGELKYYESKLLLVSKQFILNYMKI